MLFVLSDIARLKRLLMCQDRASAYLVASLSHSPSIPTIQALLIMAGRELALGVSSAGWLKSGMAFRMIEELALERDAYTDVDLTPLHDRETIYIRQRVFWSAYSWDKYVYLGATKLNQQILCSDAWSATCHGQYRPVDPASGAYVPCAIYLTIVRLPEAQWRPCGTDLVYPYQAGHTGPTFHAYAIPPSIC